MLLNEIPREKIDECIENLYTVFDPFHEADVQLVKKALSLFRKGLIFNTKVQDQTISAIVLDDGEKLKVELEIDFIEVSFCSCEEPEDIYCAHKLAVLFYVFSLYDSPGEFYNQWKRTGTTAAVIKSSITKAKGEPPYKIDSLVSWYQYFDQAYDQFIKRKQQQNRMTWAYNREAELVLSIYDEFYPLIMEVEKPPGQFGGILFHIHAALYCIEKLFETAKTFQAGNYFQHHLGTYVHELIKDILELLYATTKNGYIPDEANEKILAATGPQMMDLLLNSRDFQHDRFYLFQIICSNLLNRNDWIDEMESKFSARLEQEEKLRKQGKINYTSECRLALAQFQFMRKNDNEAIEILREGESREVFYYSTWVKALAQGQEWSRFKEWLTFIEERMDLFIHQFGQQKLKRELTDFYLLYIQEYAEETNQQEAYFHTLQKWLPYSYGKFSTYLLDEKEFQKWTELQLYLGVSVDKLGSDVVKSIEKEDRSCLLPLYHNTVEELIIQKNRDAYRKAAKYLRKLRAHYRALKDEETWEQYIEYLAKKYKRLRAFQEELRKGKGKLVND